MTRPTDMTPDEYADARAWVEDRLAAMPPEADAADMRREIAAAVAAARAPRPGRFPSPVPLPALAAGSAGAGIPWVWDGFLVRGGVTLLSALPKAGKTTLLAHFLKALAAGGEFCGRPLAAGRAVVVSEESAAIWIDRRDRLGLTGAVRLVSRPFPIRAGADEWNAFLAHLAGHLAAAPADVVVFDTLADLWPVRDENSATEVQAALRPLRRLADGRAVLLAHHLRKADGADGTGSRGSGALAGFADILCELRRAGRAADPGGAKRVLTTVGRVPGVPGEWVVELDEEAGEYCHAGAAPGTAEALRVAIRAALDAAGPAGLTFPKLFAGLPAAHRRNDNRVRDALAFGAEQGDWSKEPRSTRNGGAVYHAPAAAAPGEAAAEAAATAPPAARGPDLTPFSPPGIRPAPTAGLPRTGV